MTEIEVGDVVVLRSGSPRMTVTYVGGPPDTERRYAELTWFCGTTIGECRLDLACLEPAPVMTP